MSIPDYLERRWDTVLELAVEHLVLVGIALTIAIVVGVALGTLVYRRPKAATLAVSATSTLFTVPALAYFALGVGFLGLGWVPSVLVLTIYSLLPIVRTTITGLREVDPAVVRAATDMGMGRTQRLLRIELPLATPVIMSGVRVAGVLSVGIAAIASYVSGPGLGREIFGGLGALGSARAIPQATVGTLAVIVVALLVDALLAVGGRLLSPKGLR